MSGILGDCGGSFDGDLSEMESYEICEQIFLKGESLRVTTMLTMTGRTKGDTRGGCSLAGCV